MKKIVISITALLCIFSTTINLISALEVKTQENINIDTSIVRTDLSYSVPEQIVVVPLFIQGNSVNLSSINKFRGLYYYLIQKLGFSDIPFHYVVSEDGQIFQGNLGGDERKVQVDGIGTNIILVGYLGGTIKNGFDPRSTIAMEQLLLNISNKNSINPNRTSISNIKFVRDTNSRSVVMKSEEIEDNWKESLSEIVEAYRANYSPIPKVYTASAEIVGITTEEVSPGSEVTISISVKNEGKNGLYGGSNSGIILEKEGGGASRFFINNEWLSTSQVELMIEGQNLLPGQEDIYEIKVKAPLAFGEYSENFALTTLQGGKIESSSITFKLNMKRENIRIVQIQNTELGYLRVRSEPSTVGLEVGRVTSGERYIVVEDAGNGYIKIDLGNDQTGWVAGWLTTNI